jgi:uncharacterized protein (DUF2147 family)
MRGKRSAAKRAPCLNSALIVVEREIHARYPPVRGRTALASSWPLDVPRPARVSIISWPHDYDVCNADLCLKSSVTRCASAGMPHPLITRASSDQIAVIGGVVFLSCVSSLPFSPPSRRSFTVSSAHAAGDGYGVWTQSQGQCSRRDQELRDSTCGTVVYASPKAEADARKSGLTTLVGQQLLRDFEPTGNGNMRGKVFVPTLKVTLVGTAEFIDSRTMKAKGCVLGGLLCKSQIWTRVDGATTFAAS